MTPDELIKVMEKFKELGLSHLKTGEFELGNVSRKTKEPDLKAEELEADEIVKPLGILDQLSDEEIAYWATPYFDEIQEKKRQHAEKLALEGETHGNN
jgi:hypothetical protein